MKSVKFAVLLGALSLVFMGCPYESKVPVDDASKAKGDKAYVGKWDEKGDDSYLWDIKLDGSMYTIEKTNVKDGGDPTVYQGFLSDLGGTPYLNVWEKSDDNSSDHKYYIFQVEKRTERFKLKGMTSNVTEEFESSAALRDFIKQYQGLSFFWDKSESKDFLMH